MQDQEWLSELGAPRETWF